MRKNIWYNKALHLTALPGGRQVFRWRSIAAGELGRWVENFLKETKIFFTKNNMNIGERI